MALEAGNEKKKVKKVGPWGGNGGSSWDDGIYTGVREITLVYDQCIDSIRVEYDKNGKKVLAEKHGGNGGNHTGNVKLQYKGEVLTSISGHYGPVVSEATPVIRSLTFKSNKKTYGPFGLEEGTPFSFPIDNGIVVGFTGRSGWFLDSIGIRLSRSNPKPLPRLPHMILDILLCRGRMTSKDAEKEEDQAAQP